MKENELIENAIEYVNRVSLKLLNEINLESDEKHNLNNIVNALVSDFKFRKEDRKRRIAKSLESIDGNYNLIYLNEISKALELIKQGGIEEIKHFDFLYTMNYEKGCI